MPRYPDFLRHIANVEIARYISSKGSVRGIDDVKKLLEEAEAKYGFSSFYGDPENLRDYLYSDDFKLLIKAFKSINALDLLIKILSEARIQYSGLKTVVEAINNVLREIESEAGSEDEEA